MMWWLATAAMAKAPEGVVPGELYGFWSGWTGTAFTTPKGMVVAHPLIRSSVGVTDFWDIKAPILGQLTGPQLATEVAFVQNHTLAASFEARSKVGWGFNALDYDLVPHFSVYAGDDALIDFALSVAAQAGTKRISTSEGDIKLEEPGLKAVRPEVSFDLAASDFVWIVFTVRSDLVGWKENGAHGTLGAYMVYGRDVVGLSLGMNLTVIGAAGLGEEVESLERSLNIDLWNPPTSIPVPLPHAQMWLRF